MYQQPGLTPPSGYYNQQQTQPLYNQYQGGFQPSPSFNWEREQAQRGMDMSGSAQGNLLSGAHLKRQTQLGQQMMATEWDRYMQRLQALSAGGMNAVNTVGAAGQGAGAGMASAYSNMGNAQAQGALGSAGAWGNALNSIGGALGGINWNPAGTPYWPSGTPSGQGGGYDYLP